MIKCESRAARPPGLASDLRFPVWPTYSYNLVTRNIYKLNLLSSNPRSQKEFQIRKNGGNIRPHLRKLAIKVNIRCYVI